MGAIPELTLDVKRSTLSVVVLTDSSMNGDIVGLHDIVQHIDPSLSIAECQILAQPSQDRLINAFNLPVTLRVPWPAPNMLV
jgi:hypothetical protein